MDSDVALSYFASCGTRLIRAKLFRRVHRLCCTLLHKHIMPWTVTFFQASPPISPVSGAVPYNDVAYLKHHLESIDRKIDVLLENPLINAATVPLLAC